MKYRVKNTRQPISSHQVIHSYQEKGGKCHLNLQLHDEVGYQVYFKVPYHYDLLLFNDQTLSHFLLKFLDKNTNVKHHYDKDPSYHVGLLSSQELIYSFLSCY